MASPPGLRLWLLAGLLAGCTTAAPCDIYAAASTPCHAAHSTTRALYAAYSGPLYQLRRPSDNTTTIVSPLTPGGIAAAATQDTFCARTACVISIIYDQSGHGNHLTQAPPGGFRGAEARGYDRLAPAAGAPVTLGGQKVYGVFVAPGTGYRNNAANGTAIGDAAQGMYAVLDGSHYNGGCCFDYGNAETNSKDTGNGHMETIYFGNCRSWGTGAGKGPWIMADLENGLFSGANPKNNAADLTITWRFVTAIVKGGANKWAIRGGDAAAGTPLETYYNGARPRASGYNPMHKEGAIILGIGGDNSIGAQGTFYEGVMTTGYPSEEAENAVQANIAAAKYGAAALTSGPVLAIGSSVSLRARTERGAPRYLAHKGSRVTTQAVSPSSDAVLRQEASWTVRVGLGNSACVSFESRAMPGWYIRHLGSVLLLHAGDGSKEFAEDATFCPQSGLSGQGSSIRSWKYPNRYFRHSDGAAYAASHWEADTRDTAASFNDDASWTIGAAFT